MQYHSNPTMHRGFAIEVGRSDDDLGPWWFAVTNPQGRRRFTLNLEPRDVVADPQDVNDVDAVRDSVLDLARASIDAELARRSARQPGLEPTCE